ncbi:MAG: DNA/RNA non-specific endonuclease [Brumimicrobium sp.]|nr:DNA/RNA non-specific endonuclease [Brumimicrobium sp.]
MKKLFFILSILGHSISFSQDSQTDYSLVNEQSTCMEYLLPLFTIHGVPKNQNENDTLSILINHGYCVGYSTKYNQPRWVAYQVSNAKQDVDYSRFPFFVDDTRLNPENRIGSETFGGGYDLGHLAPNAAINRQYSKLSLMETFLMSNISPQTADLNRGVWQKLEAKIYTDYISEKEHLWVIIGPVFSENPEYITRKNKTKVAIPEAFYCILIRPRVYPYDSPGNSDYLTFLFPQQIDRKQPIDVQFLTNINEIECKTKLNFFPNLTKTMEKKIEEKIATELWEISE